MNIDYQHLPEGFAEILAVVVAITLIIWALYANTVRKLLHRIAPENRFLTPAQAWLLVVPLFNIYWNFTVANRISDSLNNEFFDRKIPEEENPGKIAGIRYALLFLFCNIPLPAFISLTFFLLVLVYFVVYWVKVYNYLLLLQEHDQLFKDDDRNV